VAGVSVQGAVAGSSARRAVSPPAAARPHAGVNNATDSSVRRYVFDPARGQEPAPWAPLIDAVLEQRYGDLNTPAAQAVREAWTRSLAASTYRTYASKLRRFVGFCTSHGRVAIPASATTVEA